MLTTNTYRRSACVAGQSVAREACLRVLLLAIGACFCLRLFAQTPDSLTAGEPSKSWTATTDLKSNDPNPTRIIESHSQSGNRTVDKQSVQIRGLDGRLVPYQDIEGETVQVDASTVRTTTRTFGRDASGAKSLLQVTEEEIHTLPGGGSNVVRTTSNADLNGILQPVQREIVETKRIGVNLDETKTTVMLPSINGGLAPVLKTDEVRKRSANDAVEAQKTTLLSDGAGNWQVSEIRQSTIRQGTDNRTTDERILRRDAEGKLNEVSRVVSKRSESNSGEKRAMVETYSIDVPGKTPDGSLHLVERATTVQRTTATGEQITDQRVEQPNSGDPDSGLRVSILMNDRMQPGPSGVQSTHTIQMRDSNGSFGVVSVDTTKSDKVPTIEVQQMP